MGKRARVSVYSAQIWSPIVDHNGVHISLGIGVITFFLWNSVVACFLILGGMTLLLTARSRSGFLAWSARAFLPGIVLFAVLHFRTRGKELMIFPSRFNTKVEIQVDVQEISSQVDRFEWFYLRGMLINSEHWGQPNHDLRISLRCKQPFSSIKIGHRYKLQCTLRPSKKYFAVGTISTPSKMILMGKSPPVKNDKNRILTWMQIQIRQLGCSFGIVWSLLCGDRTYIPPQLRKQFLQSGTIHLLAVSGLHLGMVWGLCSLILQKVLTVHTTRIVSPLLCFFYVWINAFRAPIVRAYCMLCMGTGLFLLDKGYQLIHVVFLCLVALLWWNPLFAYQISFQFSFAATIGIALSIGWCQQNPDWPLWQKSVWISFFAQMWTVPLEIYYFGKVHPLSFINSMILSPCIFLLLGCGLCAVIFPIKVIHLLLQISTNILLSCLQKIFAVLLLIPQEINVHDGLKNQSMCITLFVGLIMWNMWIHGKMLQQRLEQSDPLAKEV